MQTFETFTYELDGNLYINLTSKCTNDCKFCVRNEQTTYFGHALWLKREPTAQEVLARIPQDLSKYKEYVFCGFGEPTLRLDTLVAVGRELKARGATVRLNTNGQANLIYKRDVSAELATAVDKINVSLNESNAHDYQELCRSAFQEQAFYSLQEFAKSCAAQGIDVWFSVVDVIGEKKIQECKRIAQSCGVALRVREFIEDSK